MIEFVWNVGVIVYLIGVTAAMAGLIFAAAKLGGPLLGFGFIDDGVLNFEGKERMILLLCTVLLSVLPVSFYC